MEGAFHTYASAPQLPKLKGLYIPLWFPPPCPLRGLFPRQDQPSPAQPFSPLIHSSNCCCPSRPGGTHGNFSPHWTLPPLPVLSWERNCIMALGSIRPPFKGMESFSVGLIQGHPLPCLHLRWKGLPTTSSQRRGHHSSTGFGESFASTPSSHKGERPHLSLHSA